MKAGALFYVIAICFLLAMISSSLIFFSYSGRVRLLSSQLEQQLDANARSGLQLLMSDPSGDTTTLVLDLYGQGNDSVILYKKPWGLMDICISKSVNRDRSAFLLAMTGQKKKNMPALFIQNQNRSVHFTGEFQLEGTCYLPFGLVERSYMDKGALGPLPLKGIVKESAGIATPFNTNMRERLQKIYSSHTNTYDSVLTVRNNNLPDTVIHSFEQNTLVIYSEDPIRISGQKYTGNIRIVSAKEIVLEKGSIISDIILAAPLITIRKEFDGTLQAFASDTLVIEENCRLNYPSVIGILKSEGRPALLSVQQGSVVYGAVIGIAENTGSNKLLLDIRNDAIVKGLIYTEDILDIKGEAKGSVWASRVVLNTKSAVHENYISGARISDGLSPSFLYPVVFKTNYSTGIVKWLN